jgi:hypothetical protein
MRKPQVGDKYIGERCWFVVTEVTPTTLYFVWDNGDAGEWSMDSVEDLMLGEYLLAYNFKDYYDKII